MKIPIVEWNWISRTISRIDGLGLGVGILGSYLRAGFILFQDQ